MTAGVDIGGTNIRAGIAIDGTITNQRKALFNARGALQETLDELVNFVQPFVQPGLESIGIGVPSVVDVHNGIVFNVANIPSWERVPLKDILEDKFGVPVCVNNDVNCFILGEHRYGLAKELKNVVGISIGTGLGAGIIIDGRLYHGNNCGAGEVGLLNYLDQNIEYYASGNLFRVKFNTTAEQAFHLARRGDVRVLEYWREFGMHLGEAIKSIVYTYDPEAIILGGSLSNAYEFFEEAMHASLRNFFYPESIRRLRIYRSQDENISLLGAAALANLSPAGESTAYRHNF